MNTPNTTGPRRRPLAAALLLALALPGAAFGQTAKEAELEARIAELERMVQALVAEREAGPAAAPAAPAAPAATAAAPAAPVIQATPILPAANPDSRFSFGGFIKLDAMLTDTTNGEIADGSTGRLFYLPSATPVGGTDEGTDLDMHAQFSRFWFAVDNANEAGDRFRAYLEFDLFGGALGNEQSTNTYGVTVRHATVGWNRWLAGQTWSNFQDVAALPDAVDFVGPTEGTTFVRQAQVRYTNGPWSLSIENPETTITPYLGGTRISSDDNLAPDLTARWATRGDWGHFTVAGLARTLRQETALVDESETAFALSASGRWNINPSNDIRYMASYGSGIGRYLGLGLASDAMQRADGSLEALDGYGGFVAWRHAFNPKLRGNVFYSFAEFDNDPLLTGLAATRSAQSWHANLIYSPFPKLDIGAELILGEREIESGADGDLRRLHMHVKYSF